MKRRQEPGQQRKRWSPAQVDTLKRMWADGATVKAIAAAVGLGEEEVRGKRCGLKLERRSKGMTVDDKWPEHKKATLKREYLRGTSYGRIAEMVDKTPEQVKRQREAMKLAPRGRMAQRRTLKIYVNAEDERKIGRRAMVVGCSASAYVRRCIMRELSA